MCLVRLLLILNMLCCIPAAAQTLRVRLWSQHPPAAVQLTASPSLALQRCMGCKSVASGNALLTAHGNRVELNGQSAARLLAKGSYTLTVEGHAVKLTSPLEVTAQQGTLLLTAELPLEEYVAAVLAAEAGSLRSPEALKAMAVAARTYAVHFRGRHAAQGFDLCDSTHCQVMRPSQSNDRARAAAEATQGELLWFRGATAATYYHKDCGGVTEASGEDLSGASPPLPYLTQHSDEWCLRRAQHNWQSTLRKSDIIAALRNAGLAAPRRFLHITVAQRSSSGRVRRLRLEGQPPLTVDEESFHRAIGMALGWNQVPSALYEIEDHGDTVVLRGRGDGHGVGLCQTGADAMGEAGHNYAEILAYYYPHTQLGLTARGLGWSKLSSQQIDLMTTAPEVDQRLIPLAGVALQEAEQRSGLRMSTRLTLRVYPTVAAFRDATGEPGWVAASTRGNVIRLQPLPTLLRTRSLPAVLRHEFLHLLVESRSRPGTQLWLREGLVLTLNGDRGEIFAPRMTPAEMERRLNAPASRQELQQAYAAAAARAAQLTQRYGTATVIGWLSSGLPAELSLH